MDFKTPPPANLLVVSMRHLNPPLDDNAMLIDACRQVCSLASSEVCTRKTSGKALDNASQPSERWFVVVAAPPLLLQVSVLWEHEALEAEALAEAQFAARYICRVLGLSLSQAYGCVFKVRTAAEVYARSLNLDTVYTYQKGWSQAHQGFRRLKALEQGKSYSPQASNQSPPSQQTAEAWPEGRYAYKEAYCSESLLYCH